MTVAPSQIAEGYAKLSKITRRLREKEDVEPATVRTLLQWFGAAQRDDRLHDRISKALLWNGIRTEPWFVDQSTDGQIKFREGYFSEHRALDSVGALYINTLHLELASKRVEGWIAAQPIEPSREEVIARFEIIYALDLQDFSKQEMEAALEKVFKTLLTKDEWEAALRISASQVDTRASERNAQAQIGAVIPGPWPAVRLERTPEPPFRARRLLGRRPLVYVKPTENIRKAISLMELDGREQIPVMINERNVKGMVSWRSIVDNINSAPGTGLDKEVQFYMDKTRVSEIEADEALPDVLREVEIHQYVLVREPRDGKVIGIIATKDLASELRSLSEPFFLIGEAENRIRTIIQQIFRSQDIKMINHRLRGEHRPTRREVADIFDLEFGDYALLLSWKEFWDKLGLRKDQQTTIETLDEIREIRNQIMHFDPDGIAEERVVQLRRYVSFILGL